MNEASELLSLPVPPPFLLPSYIGIIFTQISNILYVITVYYNEKISYDIWNTKGGISFPYFYDQKADVYFM